MDNTKIIKARHTWTEKEDVLCCLEYLKYSLQNIYIKEYSPLLDKLSQQLQEISRNSIKMKLQNIKYLCEQNKIPDFIDIKSLSNYSQQNEYLFLLVTQLPEIEKLILARKHDIKQKPHGKSNSSDINDIRKLVSSYRNKRF